MSSDTPAHPPTRNPVRAVVLPRETIEHIRRSLPATHEIGGIIAHDGRVAMVAGETCWGTDGRKTRPNCSVSIPRGAAGVPFHTHPKANRPSSTDYAVATRAGGPNALFTPAGLWIYRVSSLPLSPLSVAKLRFVGHFYEPSTQAGDTDAYVRAVRALGVRARYVPYESIGAGGVRIA